MLTYFIRTTQASYISEWGRGGAGLATHISQLWKDDCPQLLQLGLVGKGTSKFLEERDTGIFQRPFKSLDCLVHASFVVTVTTGVWSGQWGHHRVTVSLN